MWRVLLTAFVALGALCVYYTGRPVQTSGKRAFIGKLLGNPNMFFLILTLGLILFRIPNVIAPEQNGDESHYIATAATVYNGAVLWKDAGGAHGPLVTMPLLIMNVIADGLNYTSIRIFGLLCIIISILFTWKTLSALFNYTIAGIIVLPLTLFYCLAQNADMIAYESETVAMSLTAFCLYLFFTMNLNGFRSWIKILLLGFFLGLIPWSKTQAVFIGFAIGGFAMLEIMLASGKDLGFKITRILLLIISALLPTMIAGIYIMKHDAFSGFWMDNITGPSIYSKVGLLYEHYTGVGKLFLIFKMLGEIIEARNYVVFSLFLLGLVFVLNYGRIIFRNLYADRNVIYITLILLTAYATVVFPGNNYTHYFTLFIVPFAIWVGICTGKIIETNGAIVWEKKFFIPYMLLLSFCLVSGIRTEPRGIYYIESGGNYKLSDVSQNILQFAHPNEKMSIWGWSPFYFVETGMTQGNYSAIINPFFFAIDSTKLSNPHLDKYVREMAVNKPIIFLDAVAPGSFYYNDTLKFRHEIFPVLNDFVSRNYQLVSIINSKRIYVLNSRLAEMGYQKN